MISEEAKKMLELDDELRRVENNLHHMAKVIQSEYQRKELIINKMRVIKESLKGKL